MKFVSGFKRLYSDKSPLSSEDYERSRRIFLVEGCSGSTVFALTSGAFVAGYANFLGADDQFNGIIGALPAFAGIAQLFSSMLFEKLEHRKSFISIIALIHRLLLGLMFFIPLIVTDSSLRLGVLAIVFGFSYLLGSFMTPAASNWIVDLTPGNMRGRYFALKDALSLAFLTVATLVIGKIMDYYKDNGHQYNGFVINAFIIFILAIINFLCICAAKEPSVKRNPHTITLKKTIVEPFKDTKFRKIIILFVIWNIGLQIGGPFFAVYMVTGLKLDYTYIMIIGFVASVVRVLVTPYWGRLADRKSWVYTTKVSIGILAVSHFSWSLTTHSVQSFLLPFAYIVSSIAWAGIGISLFNIQFIFSPEEGRTMFLASNGAIGGVLGFASSVAGSFLVGMMGKNTFELMGVSFCGMQITFAISAAILVICVIFIHKYIKVNDEVEIEAGSGTELY